MSTRARDLERQGAQPEAPVRASVPTTAPALTTGGIGSAQQRAGNAATTQAVQGMAPADPLNLMTVPQLSAGIPRPPSDGAARRAYAALIEDLGAFHTSCQQLATEFDGLLARVRPTMVTEEIDNAYAVQSGARMKIVSRIAASARTVEAHFAKSMPVRSLASQALGLFGNTSVRRGIDERIEAESTLHRLNQQLADKVPQKQLVELVMRYRTAAAELVMVKAETPQQTALAGGADPARDYRTLKAKLGSGAVNSVSLVEEVATGNRFVFKADKRSGMVDLDRQGSNIEEGAAAFSNRAVATYKLNQLFGLNVVPDTRFAIHNGYFGHVMALAQGQEPRREQAVPVANKDRLEMFREQLRGAAESADLDAMKYLKEKGVSEKDGVIYETRHAAYDMDFSHSGMQEGLSALQLLDLVTGQLDRHSGNYFVHVDRGTGEVKITAIDNDAAFGASHTDLTKQASNKIPGLPAVVSRAHYEKLTRVSEQQVRQEIAGLLSADEIEATVTRFRQLVAHLQQLDQSGHVVDGYNEQSFAAMTDANSYAGREAAHLEHLKKEESHLVAAFSPIGNRPRSRGGASPPRSEEAMEMRRRENMQKRKGIDLAQLAEMQETRRRETMQNRQGIDVALLAEMEDARRRANMQKRKGIDLTQLEGFE